MREADTGMKHKKQIVHSVARTQSRATSHHLSVRPGARALILLGADIPLAAVLPIGIASEAESAATAIPRAGWCCGRLARTPAKFI